MSNYVNLHTHTHYSTLDGLDTPDTYMERAKEIGMTHLAITDHGTLAGHREFQEAAKRTGVIPILGVEGYVSATDRFDRRAQAKREDGTSVYNHITILAQNETGLRTLNTLSELAWTEGYYFKPRMDTDLIEEHNDGIIVLSGCMSGLVAKEFEKGNPAQAHQWAQRYKSLLGDRYFIEVMSTNSPELNHFLLEIADKYQIKPVMTTDCHYARKEDLWIEEAMLILSTNPKWDKTADLSKAAKMDFLERYNYLYPDRTMTFQQIEIYLRDYKTEVEQFKAQGIDRTDIYANTIGIANSVGEYPYYENLDILPSPGRENPDKDLHSKTMHGLRKRGLADKPEYIERANHELEIIKSKNFSVYFLIVEDLISWAESQDIMVGPGRGSSAGSLVCYALGITKVDPIKYGCLFERFLDESRGDWPDIDMDFEDKRRNEVKEYLVKKYGYVANIATFNKFGGKSSIKDAARVFRIPVSEVNRATKDNDPPEGVDFYDHFAVAKQSKEFARKYPEVVKLARRLNGKNRSMGMHAAGVVVSKVAIERYAPVETAKDPNDKEGPRIKYVALDMNQCASLGAIKLDLLGLKALSVIKDTIRSVAKRHGKIINPYSIPLDDAKVYEMLSSGYTKGVFQMEQPAYTRLIINMGGVNNFDDLVASNALVRPGAMNTIGKEYIARKMGKKSVTFAHPLIRGFTESTYGMVTLFQEQVMMLTQVIGGLTPAESNQLRRGLGKKDVKYIKPFEEKFKQNAVEHISQTQADKLWKDIEAGAGYSFNIAHSVSYSLLGYVTAWLKVNYPLEFMMATIANEKDKDSITDYLLEAKRMGIRILLPHVNHSGLHTEIQGDAIRLGLTNIKYIRDKVGSAILQHRPFDSYAELEAKVMERGSGMNSRMLGAMNKVGAAVFPDNPKTGHERENFYEYLQIPAFEVKELPPYIKYRFRDIEDYSEEETFCVLALVRSIKKGEGWARVDVLDETGSAGIFANADVQLEKGQLYAILVSNNRIARYLTMDELVGGVETQFSKWLHGELPDIPENKSLVISFKTRVTKAGKKMADIVFVDHLNQLNSAMVFPDNGRDKMYSRAFVKCKPGFLLNIEMGETEGGALFVKDIK